MAKDVRCQKYFMIRISDHGCQLIVILIRRKNSPFRTKPTRLRAATSVVSSLLRAFLPQHVTEIIIIKYIMNANRNT